MRRRRAIEFVLYSDLDQTQQGVFESQFLTIIGASVCCLLYKQNFHSPPCYLWRKRYARWCVTSRRSLFLFSLLSLSYSAQHPVFVNREWFLHSLFESLAVSLRLSLSQFLFPLLYRLKTEPPGQAPKNTCSNFSIRNHNVFRSAELAFIYLTNSRNISYPKATCISFIGVHYQHYIEQT